MNLKSLGFFPINVQLDYEEFVNKDLVNIMKIHKENKIVISQFVNHQKVVLFQGILYNQEELEWILERTLTHKKTS